VMVDKTVLVLIGLLSVTYLYLLVCGPDFGYRLIGFIGLSINVLGVVCGRLWSL